jgi:lipoic acid synthetase
MVGLGETDHEVEDAMQRLRDAGVELLTLGQYLTPGRPGERFLPVDRFVSPEQFDAWGELAREIGFLAVASGPLVRSSYRAGLLLEQAREKANTVAEVSDLGPSLKPGSVASVKCETN